MELFHATVRILKNCCLADLWSDCKTTAAVVLWRLVPTIRVKN